MFFSSFSFYSSHVCIASACRGCMNRNEVLPPSTDHPGMYRDLYREEQGSSKLDRYIDLIFSIFIFSWFASSFRTPCLSGVVVWAYEADDEERKEKLFGDAGELILIFQSTNDQKFHRICVPSFDIRYGKTEVWTQGSLHSNDGSAIVLHMIMELLYSRLSFTHSEFLHP